MNDRSILLSPELRRGSGLGHLARCVEALNRRPDRFVIHLPFRNETFGREEVRRLAPVADELIDERAAPWDDYGLVVLDRRHATAAEVPRRVPSLGIDLGGPARDLVDYLVDTLPTLPNTAPANRRAPGLRLTPRNRRSSVPRHIRTVLLTFGGEDPAGLTGRLAKALGSADDRRPFPDWEVTLVRGPANTARLPEGFRVLDSPQDLRERLADYDLVITSFGLTAFEARDARCAVVTFNPSRYHERLAVAAGFASIGVRRPSLAKLRALASDPARLLDVEPAEPGNEGTGPQSLADVVDRLDFGGAGASPLTSGRHNPVVARFADRTYYRCRATGIIFMKRFDRLSPEYDHDYFFDEYAGQYGRTYLEDFDHIRSLAAPRLSRILSMRSGGSLLDVGCAFGPFLETAREAGYEAFGVDVNQEAVDYVRDVLGIRCVRSDFRNLDAPHDLAKSEFDILTMWFVIEHFSDLDRVLRRANRLLPRGGIFAFSTPNVAGISGRRSLRGFLARSPMDHFTVWSPATARVVLRRYGFSVASVRVTGHHPERFGKAFAPRPSVFHAGASVVSRALGLGDTFEVYAYKDREITGA